VIDHYENPRNVGSMDKADTTVGTGLVGAPACGDVMKLQVTYSTLDLNGCCNNINTSRNEREIDEDRYCFNTCHDGVNKT